MTMSNIFDQAREMQEKTDYIICDGTLNEEPTYYYIGEETTKWGSREFTLDNKLAHGFKNCETAKQFIKENDDLFDKCKIYQRVKGETVLKLVWTYQ